ncbi:Proteophosphoglycan 5 [Rhodotorula toruloides]|uniref:Proteophosphoglycan 5 n=1 Tax=Rhodotorula toruloides TaxID=5286 RepID=A0A2S9ZYJ5_RHOTO|nr:Proteophosphoglycan 5 [Rhodotorula toruloides]
MQVPPGILVPFQLRMPTPYRAAQCEGSLVHRKEAFGPEAERAREERSMHGLSKARGTRGDVQRLLQQRRRDLCSTVIADVRSSERQQARLDQRVGSSLPRRAPRRQLHKRNLLASLPAGATTESRFCDAKQRLVVPQQPRRRSPPSGTWTTCRTPHSQIPCCPRPSSKRAQRTADDYSSMNERRPKSPGAPFHVHDLFPTSLGPLLILPFLLVTASFLLLFARLDSTSLLGPRRVRLRAVEDNHAGLGSVVGQTRLAAALANAVDVQLVVPHDPTGHGYSAADFINPEAPVTLDTTSVCVLSGRLAREAVEGLPHDARRFCDTGELSGSLQRLKECTVIVDDRPWEYRRDLADCTSDRWDGIIRVPSPPTRIARSKAIVAIHVRWGDTKSRIGFDSPTKNATLRSVPLAVAEPIVETLASCRELDVHVYMEDGAKDLFPLSHPYTLHDIKGVLPLDELRAIASADIRLTATGGFASLIHWSARHGLSIVPVQSTDVTPYYTPNERIKVAYQRDFIKTNKSQAVCSYRV